MEPACEVVDVRLERAPPRSCACGASPPSAAGAGAGAGASKKAAAASFAATAATRDSAESRIEAQSCRRCSSQLRSIFHNSDTDPSHCPASLARERLNLVDKASISEPSLLKTAISIKAAGSTASPEASAFSGSLLTDASLPLLMPMFTRALATTWLKRAATPPALATAVAIAALTSSTDLPGVSPALLPRAPPGDLPSTPGTAALAKEPRNASGSASGSVVGECLCRTVSLAAEMASATM